MEKNKAIIDIKEILKGRVQTYEQGNRISTDYEVIKKDEAILAIKEVIKQTLEYTITKIGEEVKADYNWDGGLLYNSYDLKVFVKKEELERIREKIAKDLEI